VQKLFTDLPTKGFHNSVGFVLLFLFFVFGFWFFFFFFFCLIDFGCGFWYWPCFFTKRIFHVVQF